MGLILHNTEGSKLNHVYSPFNLLSDSWNNWTDPSKYRVQHTLTMPISHLIFSVTLGVTFPHNHQYVTLLKSATKSMVLTIIPSSLKHLNFFGYSKWYTDISEDSKLSSTNERRHRRSVFWVRVSSRKMAVPIPSTHLQISFFLVVQ